MILATVSSDPSFHGDVRAVLDSRFRFESVWNLGYEDVARLHGVPAYEHCLNIIDFSVQDRALAVAHTLGGRPQVATIAVNGGKSRDEVLLLMQAGVRDVLPNFTSHDLFQAANRAFAVLGSGNDVLGDIYSFVPAKPGCGATTVATNVAGMVSNMTDESTLLLDFDIRLGVTTFLLKAGGRFTIVDALQQVKQLDRKIWATLVSHIGKLHLLGSGAGDFSRPFLAEEFRELVDFAVRQYSVVTVDLPGLMDDYECDVLRRSKRILLVCTPDIGALHVARRKAQLFRDLRLTDKVSVAVNCVERRSTLSVKDIEQTIQLPVRYLLPTGTKDVTKAVQGGEILESTCPLGRQVAAIASEMVPAKSGANKPSTMRRFVEYFSVSTARI